MLTSILLITCLVIPGLTALVVPGLTAEIVVWTDCTDLVYCNYQHGQDCLLKIVQQARVYSDSKTYVDMTQIHIQEETLDNYNKMMKNTNKKPKSDDVKKFFEKNFKNESDSDPWTPSDFNGSPSFLKRIPERRLRTFATNLVNYWPLLGRKTREHVKLHPSQHSILWTSNGYIIPGGRFKEQSYWDSYWIIKGLLLSEMKETVKGMLDNFIQILHNDKDACIPRSLRTYLQSRPAPPLLAPMIALYIENTKDIEWLKRNIEAVELHYTKYWNLRTITVTANDKEYSVAHYGDIYRAPRPEYWMEDEIACASYTGDKNTCYEALRAGGESGWDYSTRWMYDDEGGTKGTLSYVNYKRTVPVDLNAILCQSARLLSDFYDKVGNEKKKQEYSKSYKDKMKDLEELFYNRADGMWYDFDQDKQQHRRLFYLSNFAPLWTDCVYSDKKEYYGKKAVEYIHSQGADKYEGGVPASLNKNSNMNWDFPNVWPPLQEIVVTGLHNTGNFEAKELAKKLAIRYIAASRRAWSITNGSLYDKYSAMELGQPGTDGEYPVQIGYGWSIGVTLSFIDQFRCTTCSARILEAILNPLFYTAVVRLVTCIGKLLLYY